MAVLAVAAIGAGAFSSAGIAWFGMSAAMTGWTVGSLVGQYIFAPHAKDVHNEGPRLDDLRVTTSSYGVIRPFGYGTYPVGGNIIDKSELYETSHTDSASTGGGKGGGGSTVYNTTYTYSVDLAVGLGKGEIENVLQIYANETLIYDITGINETVRTDWLRFAFYNGDDTQLPDPTLQAIHGDETPAYRGEAYIVFTQFQLAEFGNTIPSFRFVVTRNATQNYSDEMLNLNDSEITNYSFTDILSTKNSTIVATFGENSIDKPVGSTIGYIVNPYTNTIINEITSIEAPGYSPDTYSLGYIHDIMLCNFWSPYRSMQPDGLIICTLRRRSGLSQRYIAIIDPISGEYLWSFLCPSSYTYRQSSIYTERAVIYSFSSTALSRIEVSLEYNPITFQYDYNYEFTNGLLETGWYPPTNYIAGIFRRVDSGGVIMLPIHTTGYADTKIIFFGDNEWLNSGYVNVQFEIDFFSLPGDYGIPFSYVNFAYDNNRDLVYAYGNYRYHFPSSNTIFIIAYNTLGEVVDYIDIYNEFGYTTTAGSEKFTYDSSSDSLSFGTFILHLSTNQLEYFNAAQFFNTTIYNHSTNSLISAVSMVSGTPYIYAGVYKQGMPMTGGGESLDDIVADICNMAGYDASDYDVTDLSAITVAGYRIAREGAAIDFLKPLSNAYFFDIIDTSSQILFLRHGQGSEINIIEDELGCSVSNSSNSKLQLEKLNREEIPSKVSLTYMNPNKYYENNTQTVNRICSNHSLTSALSFPISFTDTEAAQIADAILHMMNVESEIYVIYVPPTKLNVLCGDIVTFTCDNRSYVGRVIQNLFENGYVVLKLLKYDSSIRTSTIVGISASEQTASVSGIIPPIIYILDIPALRSSDFNAGIYIAATAYSSSWPGGELYSGIEDGTLSQTSTLPQSIVGYANGTVFDVPANRWDTETILNVTVNNGELETINELQTLNNTNVAAWGSSGRWEIVCFQNAVLTSNNTYTVSKLLRGRRNTSHNMNLHQDGDAFIILNNTNINRINNEITEIGQTYDYMGVTYGMSIQSDSNILLSNTISGEALKPFAPTHIETHEDSGDLAGSWFYRSRYFSQMLWNPANSDEQDFEIDIVDGGDVLRTITTTASGNGSVIDEVNQTFVYDAADQTADGVSATFDIYVYQLSSTVGRGNPGIMTTARTV